jgi:hypothetical protein
MSQFNINATYGIMNHFINVTHKLIEHFQVGDKIIIPKKCDFSKYFDDPHPSKVKYLLMEINNNKYLVKEDHITQNLEFPIQYSESKNIIIEKKVIIVYYAWINPKAHWENIIIGQLTQLVETKLLDIADMYVHVTGPDEYLAYAIEIIKRIIPICIINTSTVNQFEYPGIHLIWSLANKNPNKIYLYFHSKGMRRGKNDRIDHDKKLFQVVIVSWKKVLNIFDEKKTVNKIGASVGQEGHIWFNFWWVRGSYLIECAEPIINLLENKCGIVHDPHQAIHKLDLTMLKN